MKVEKIGGYKTVPNRVNQVLGGAMPLPLLLLALGRENYVEEGIVSIIVNSWVVVITLYIPIGYVNNISLTNVYIELYYWCWFGTVL